MAFSTGNNNNLNSRSKGSTKHEVFKSSEKAKIAKNLKKNKGSLKSGTADLGMDLLEDVGSVVGNVLKDCLLKTDQVQIPTDMLGIAVQGLGYLITQYKGPGGSALGGPEGLAIKAHYYKTYFGKSPKGRYKVPPFGHSKVTRLITDTRQEASNESSKLQCLTQAGFNQAAIDFFDDKTFISLEDLHYLTGCEAEIAKVKNMRTARKEKNKTKEKTTSKLAKQQVESFGNQRINSVITRIKTKLYINADMNSYITNVRVYLCTHALFTNCEGRKGAHTTEEIVKGILNNIASDDENSIKKNELIGKVNSPSNKFKKTLLVTPGTDIKKCQTIKDYVRILRVYNLQLRPTEVGIIEMIHNYPKGIDLNDLDKCSINEASAHTFYMVESVGASNARITQAKNPNIKYNGTAPIKLRYELENEITFISNDKQPDRPIVIVEKEKEKNFEELELAKLFYPKRENKFNVNIDKIDIGNNNPKAPYILDVDLETLKTPTFLERMQKVQDIKNIDIEDSIRILSEEEETANGTLTDSILSPIERFNKLAEQFKESDYNEDQSGEDSEDMEEI